MIWILILLFIAAAYFYHQNQQRPLKAYEWNINKALEYKNEFLEYLDKEIKMRGEQLEKKATAAKISTPERRAGTSSADLETYHKKLKTGAATKDIWKYLQELYWLQSHIVPAFDHHLVRLNTRYKNDVIKLAQISDDYRDWYYHQARLFDPSNYELWNESSYEDQDEARVVITEINKKLDFDMEMERAGEA
jgi:hypothetical protein